MSWRLDQRAGQDAFGELHSTFQRYVCWDPDRVARVMDTEALQTSPAVFLATHSPIPLFRRDLTRLDALGQGSVPYTEEQFLQDLMAAPDYAFVAVVGGSGTGKSHLVRWLSTRISESESRRVLLIPRAGTSLRDILTRILDGATGERFDEYRRRLAQASASLTEEQTREALLDALAMAVASHSVPGVEMTEERDYLASELPHLLRDPAFRPYFLQPNGVIDCLVSHILGTGGVERAEERRGFTVEDLPLTFSDVARASHLAQAIHRDLVANEPLRPAAVEWLNLNLDTAVARLMQMSGTDLVRLMKDVRVSLAARGVELVLLIEDLATLQGIDHQLIEALLVRPHQPGEPDVCALRAVLAMTNGYYTGLAKGNVRSRFDFLVLMGEEESRDSIHPDEMERFTAKYLNAARVSPERLALWYRDGAGSSTESPEAVPNACSECCFRTSCHDAFGSRDGIGLYPFTDTAIQNISERVSGGFNPRALLKEGYKPILENSARALHDGRFPEPEMLQRLGGTRLTALFEADLQKKDPTTYRRRAALLDLWGSPDTRRELSPGIYSAFALPLIGLESREPLEPAQPAGPTLKAPLIPSLLEKQLKEIEAWRTGGRLSQDLTQALRELVYAAVVGNIDWNALHLIPGDFTGTVGFRRTGVSFVRQFLTPGQAAIRLPIPLHEDDDLTQVALALQGLLEFQHYGTWQFDGGASKYRAYLRHVDAWSEHVLGQINDLTESGESWDPVPAAAELLAVGARILGRPAAREPERQDVVDALFADYPEREERHRSVEWQGLTRLARTNQPKVRQILMSRIACSKGASRRLQIIDVAQILPTIVSVRQNWRPQEQIPGKLVRSLRAVADYREGIDALADQAVQAERAHQVKRYDQVAEQLGAAGDCTAEYAAARRTETATALRAAVDSAAEAGLLIGSTRAAFGEALTVFDSIQFQAWAQAIARLRSAPDSPWPIAEINAVPAQTADVAVGFVGKAMAMLDRTERVLDDEINSQSASDGHDLGQIQADISRGLDSLIEQLVMLANPKAEQVSI